MKLLHKPLMSLRENLWWFSCGTLLGLTTLSIAMGSVPRGRVTDDTAIYQNLSEIRAQKQADLNFDSDIDRLARAEGRYREKKLPNLADDPRISGPMNRIARQKYKYQPSSSRSVQKRSQTTVRQ